MGCKKKGVLSKIRGAIFNIRQDVVKAADISGLETSQISGAP
jgi:hypothetical protein